MAENKVSSWSSNEENNSIIANYSFLWTISEFSLQTSDTLISPSFYVGINELVEWNLQAYPNGINKDCEGYFSLFLNLMSESEVIVDYNFFIVNTKKLKVNENSSSKRKFYSVRQGWGRNKFIARNDILDKSNGLLSDDDKLTIACDITVYGCNENKSSKVQVIDDFRQILVSKKFSDVTLVVGNQEIQAHKNILAARSPVFAAMFSNDMKESKNNRIDIIDIEPDVVDEMLHFIYTDQVQNIQKVATDLLVAADKYDLQRLKVMCEKAIFASLTTDNATEMLVFADLHNSNGLKTKIIDFICTNAKEMMESGKLKSIVTSHPNLIYETFEAHLAIKKPPSSSDKWQL